jgi:hypothetical protein
MEPPRDRAYWTRLEEQADRPDTQAIIREAIRQGFIRVLPKPGGGVQIVPLAGAKEPNPRARDRANRGNGTKPHSPEPNGGSA